MILQRGRHDKSTMLFLSLHGESLGTRLVVNIKIDNSNDFMYAYSLCHSTILFHIRWELSLCCMRVNSSDWNTRRRVALCKNVDTCHARAELWLPPSCVPVTTVLPLGDSITQNSADWLVCVLSPSHFHLSYAYGVSICMPAVIVLHEAGQGCMPSYNIVLLE